MKINTVIVEDNSDNIKTLKYLLGLLPHEMNVMGEARTVDEAYELLKNNSIELAFLDIQLRKGTTFDVLQRLYSDRIKLPEIVFVTAHGSFENALKAIQYACLDFVTKPFDEDTIGAAVQRFVDKKTAPSSIQQDQVGFLLDLLKGDIQKPKSIAINLSNGVIEFVELKDILFLQADENTCKVRLSSDKFLHSTKHLGHYMELLMGHAEFVQISKSCMVNTDHLKQYNQREKTLLLKNGESLIASHRFSRNLKKQLVESQQKKSGFLGRLFGGS